MSIHLHVIFISRAKIRTLNATSIGYTADTILIKNNIKDIITKCKWNFNAKTSKFYKNAISTWTERDVNKYNIAKKNNLNYLVFYTEKEFKDYFNQK